ncbi:MAG: hypothetical protein C4333_11245 [Meiothermus sp.]
MAAPDAGRAHAGVGLLRREVRHERALRRPDRAHPLRRGRFGGRGAAASGEVARHLRRAAAGGLSLSTLGFALGYLARPKAASTIANLVYLPLSFASGFFFPLSRLPEFLREMAPYLPTYHIRATGLDHGGLEGGRPSFHRGQAGRDARARPVAAGDLRVLRGAGAVGLPPRPRGGPELSRWPVAECGARVVRPMSYVVRRTQNARRKTPFL